MTTNENPNAEMEAHLRAVRAYLQQRIRALELARVTEGSPTFAVLNERRVNILMSEVGNIEATLDALARRPVQPELPLPV